jgi:hypothetical protein
MEDIKFRVTWQRGSDKVIFTEVFSWLQIKNGCLQYNDGNELCVELFTGQPDKNKQEICEGDIIEYNEERGVVEFEEGCFWLSFDTWTNTISEFYPYELEVIGNIHNNLELLGQ